MIASSACPVLGHGFATGDVDEAKRWMGETLGISIPLALLGRADEATE
jgi:hypothetical protein